MRLFGCAFIYVLVIVGIDARKPSFYRTYECQQGHKCQRTTRPINIGSSRGAADPTQHLSLQACRLVCSTSAGLWPIPTGESSFGSNYLAVNPRNFNFNVISELDKSARLFMSTAADAFIYNVERVCAKNCKPLGRKVVVNFKIESSSIELNWDTNESYDLEITASGSDMVVIISSQTVFGARHALETLSQLVAPVPGLNGTNELVMLDLATVRDKPVFPHRGLLIDTARNFLPVSDIFRTIDGLAATKMNILHWHATDSQSFPLEIRSVPMMATYGAYSPEQIYSVEEMRTIKNYALSKGVRVILEIDSPSHAGAGWEWGESEGLGNLAVCVNQQPWRSYCIEAPCGQLNPVNPNTFKVLGKIYKELLQTFGRSGMVHLGGDELFINCWNATEEVTQGMAKLGLGRNLEDFLKIWSSFHNKELEMLDKESELKDTDKVILWSSQLTQPDVIENYLNKTKYIIQTWVEADKDLNKKLLDLGYQLIVSTKDAWYLDHGFWGVTKYHTWRDAYKNKIPQNPGVLGGEACMWGEYLSSASLDSRVWPRTAAVGERLWSDPSKIGTGDAEPRLQAHIDRLKSRWILPEAITPEWCNQHEGQCL